MKKDLIVLTADLDALAVMRAVLSRPEALGIRPIEFLVDRHTGRDSGMVQSGPELARRFKAGFEKLILLWDHEGSGWERRFSVERAESEIQNRLDLVTWKGAATAITLVPELEEWLWQNTASIRSYFGIDEAQLEAWLLELAAKNGLSRSEALARKPKELFEHVVYHRLRRTISPRDFENIAKRASLRDWQRSRSFGRLAGILRDWFPPG